MKLLPEHVEGARGMLKMSQDELAQAASVSVRAIRRFEAGTSNPQEDTLVRIQAALEERGITFTNGGRPGVQLDKSRSARREAPQPL